VGRKVNGNMAATEEEDENAMSCSVGNLAL
jgi:hypothetical protein